MKAKYVMTFAGPILFPESIPHDAFRAFQPVSAGFVSINQKGDISTYGKSVSLNLEPKEYDSILIECAFEERRNKNEKKSI